MTDHIRRGRGRAECIGVSDFGPNGVDVYEVTNGYTRIAEAVFDRDAALIAAAPDLLALIRRIAAYRTGRRLHVYDADATANAIR